MSRNDPADYRPEWLIHEHPGPFASETRVRGISDRPHPQGADPTPSGRDPKPSDRIAFVMRQTGRRSPGARPN